MFFDTYLELYRMWLILRLAARRSSRSLRAAAGMLYLSIHREHPGCEGMYFEPQGLQHQGLQLQSFKASTHEGLLIFTARGWLACWLGSALHYGEPWCVVLSCVAL